MPTYLDRYLAGEYEQVWDEVMACGAAVREEPLYADALAVARETMRRARFNVETLVERLRGNGYQFDYPHLAFVPPTSQFEEDIKKLLRQAEAIPLSLMNWYDLVGEVCFSGTHPDWQVCGANCEHEYSIEYDASGWYDRMVETSGKVHIATESLEARDIAIWDNRLVIAEDRAARAGYSGGDVWIKVPNHAIDTSLEETYPKGETFVQYLRRSFRWGGFPGFADVDESLRPTAMLAQLTEGLLSI
jgi:hypothetical protein